ncbi:MAG TPA: Clp protease N-terminal domain-containing protein [Acidimicrobiales bacterium]|nr:Clp protease N-terminal domain-containing protein [Acidimicrobiales bacterium]
MFERFTDRARTVILLAQQAALDTGADHLDAVHLLVGLHREGTGVAAVVLKEARAAEPELSSRAVDDATALAAMGIDLGEVRSQLAESFGADAAQPVAPFTDEAKAVLQRALQESYELGHDYVGTEHLLLALDVDGVHRHRVLELAAPNHLRLREAERRLLQLFRERPDSPAIAAAGEAKRKASLARAEITRTLADELEAALATA